MSALRDGRFIAAIRAGLDEESAGKRNANAISRLEDGIKVVLAGNNLTALESDYIGLFDANRDATVVHPYAHLHGPQTVDRITLFKQLRAFYHDCGIKLRDSGGADQPDHLSVQLECLAFLYVQIGNALDGGNAERADRFSILVEQFLPRLAWVRHFAAALKRRDFHPLFHPLAQVLAGKLA